MAEGRTYTVTVEACRISLFAMITSPKPPPLLVAVVALVLGVCGCSSSCKVNADCGKDFCVQTPPDMVRCYPGQAWDPTCPTECAVHCSGDGGCATTQLCVTRYAVVSTGDNYDNVYAQLEQVCLPKSETDGGTWAKRLRKLVATVAILGCAGGVPATVAGSVDGVTLMPRSAMYVFDFSRPGTVDVGMFELSDAYGDWRAGGFHPNDASLTLELHDPEGVRRSGKLSLTTLPYRRWPARGRTFPGVPLVRFSFLWSLERVQPGLGDADRVRDPEAE